MYIFIVIRLVEYILQPVTHKINSASPRSSHRCPLLCPLLPLHSIPGVVGDIHLVCYVFVHTYCSRVAKFLPPTVAMNIVVVTVSFHNFKSQNFKLSVSKS